MLAGGRREAALIPARQGEAALAMADSEQALTVTIHLHGRPVQLEFEAGARLSDLSERVATTLLIPAGNQKFLIRPRVGLVRPPFGDGAGQDVRLASVRDAKIVVMGSSSAEVAGLAASVEQQRQRQRQLQVQLQKGTTSSASSSRGGRRDWQQARDDATYTFHTLAPLAHLPRPQRSLAYLERLRDDAGIRACMRRHRFSVALLTEMEPALHTRHDGRTLGLNRNGGEVIELRLRTDAADGYRHYPDVRRTLCHELAHNVWAAHDARFWRLCRQLEAEVERDDWTTGGTALSSAVFSRPAGVDELADDHGGWTGGEYVLGVGGSGSATTTAATAATVATASNMHALSRREILARAAEARMRRSQSDSPERTADE